MEFDLIAPRLNELRARHKLVSEQVTAEQDALDACEGSIAALREATAISQEITKQLQQQAHTAIATTVSRCLGAVFDEPYEFKIRFESKRGRTEAQLVFCRDGETIDPMTAAGGGVVDVAAFALRVSTLFLQKPAVRKLLILDEPFRFVSAEYLPRVAALLEMLSVEMELQIVLVTHVDELRIGEVIEIE